MLIAASGVFNSWLASEINCFSRSNAFSAGSVTKRDKTKALNLGADAYVSKPFTAEDIINKIRILLHFENILDDMSIWDVKEIMNHARQIYNYADVRIIHMETEQEAVIKGDYLIDSDSTFESIMPKDILEKCKERVEDIKQYMAVKNAEYILNTRGILYKGGHF